MTRIALTLPRAARALYYPPKALEGLRALGELRLNDGEDPWTIDEAIAAAQGCRVIVAGRETPGPARLFGALPDLAAFVRMAVDIRNVDVGAASATGVLVTRASPGFATAVAELIVGFMIDLARGVTAATLACRAGRAPDVTMGRELGGAALGVIGYGVIGRRLAVLGQALGMRVLAADPHAAKADDGVERVGLPDLLARADFVACLAVASEQTENLMNAAAFARMKPGAFFINASRGNLVDEAALVAALDSGRLGGAALDVGRAPDQMPTPALAAHPRVIATPHIGGLTPEAVAHQALETVRQCAAILRGEAPDGAVNAEYATRLSGLAADAAAHDHEGDA